MKFTFAPDAMPLPDVRIVRGIQRGGFGEVYEGLSSGGKRVALKLLREDAHVEVRGAKQCLNLKHPNLVDLYDVRADADGDHWIIMEYVAGVTLSDVLADHPKGLPEGEVAMWLEGIVKGVSFLHRQGIVHRDLKPSNIYLEDGRVKIGDVGLSKLLSTTGQAHTQQIGTVAYMAPEVGRGQYGKSVDQYSLGIVLYELLTGRLPFDGESNGEILMRHLTAAPDLDRVPKAWRKVVATALEKDPGRRFRSVEELLNAAPVRAGREESFMVSPAMVTEFFPTRNGSCGPGKTCGPHWREARPAALQKPWIDLRPEANFSPFSTDLLRAGWSGSCAWALVLSALLAGGLGGIEFSRGAGADVALIHGVIFGGTLAASVLIAQTLLWWHRSRGGELRVSRFEQAIAGAIAGGVGFLLTQYLYADGRMSDPLLQSHGSLVEEMPRLMNWCGTFAAMFALQTWSRYGSLVRESLFRVGPVLAGGGIGFGLSHVTHFPLSWGLLWGAAVPCLLQLSSPRIEGRDRFRWYGLLKERGSFPRVS